MLRLQIGEPDRDVTYSSRVTWPDWFTLTGAWDDGERIWVASGDTGVSVFERRDGEWRRYAWEPGPAAASRPPLEDVGTGEVVEWIDAEPPAELRGSRHGA
jgi:hypothetical protein